MASEYQKKKIAEKYQVKGDPKDGRKTSKPKVTESDELSSAHDNEAFRKKNSGNKNNRGGR